MPVCTRCSGFALLAWDELSCLSSMKFEHVLVVCLCEICRWAGRLLCPHPVYLHPVILRCFSTSLACCVCSPNEAKSRPAVAMEDMIVRENRNVKGMMKNK